MRCLLLIALCACGASRDTPPAPGPGSSVVPPKPPPPAVSTPPSGPPKLDLAALVAGSDLTCGGFDKMKRADLGLIEGRLTTPAPQGSADIPKSYDVMGAPSPTTQESRLILESKRGGKFVIYARELYQSAPADFGTAAPGYFAATTGLEAANLTVGKIEAEGLMIAAARPIKPKADGEAVLVLATLVRTPDNTLVGVDYYVNPTALAAGCSNLALDLAHGLRAGKRALPIAGGVQTLSGMGKTVDITVPAGWVMTKQPAEDFDVYSFIEVLPLGLWPGKLTIYVGQYPDTTVPTGGTPVTKAGKIGGVAVTWQGWTSAKAGALVANLPADSRGVVIQVIEQATLDAAFLAELDQLVATIKIR